MVELIKKTCPVCGVYYGLDKEYAGYRGRGGASEDKKVGWYCPNGHYLVVSESEAEKLRRERDRLQQRLAEKDDTIRALEKSRRAVVGQVTKLRNRISNGVCPCCTRSFTNLHRHMATKHPDFRAEAIAGAV